MLALWAAVFAEVRRNVRRILRAIRGNARYLGKVAIVHYYPTPPPLLFVSGAVRALNRAMDRAARPFQVVVADSDREFRRAASHSGANACDAGLLTQLDGQIGNCGIHPSDAGQRLLAQALEKAIKL